MTGHDLEKQQTRRMQLVGAGLQDGWLFEYDGNITTTQVKVTFTDVDGPFLYHVTAESYVEARTKPQITHISLSPKDPHAPTPIQRNTLNAVPLQLLRDRVGAVIAAHFAGEGSHYLTATTMAENLSLHQPRDGKQLSDDHYKHVSWWYCIFLLQGFHPRESLAKKYQRHPVTISRWLAEARRRGHLPPHEPIRQKDQLDKLKAWNRSNEIAYRQIASRVLTQQLDKQIKADLNRPLVDSDAGQDVIGAFIKALADGSDDLSMDVRTLVTVKVLEEIAESDMDTLSRTASEFLQQLYAAHDGQS